MLKTRVKNQCSKDVLRIIDANLNRLREGLRVCEDTIRFILNNKALTQRIKLARHRIDTILKSSRLDSFFISEYRDVARDVAKDFSLLEKRKDWKSVFFANMQRSKESLRVLEEFFKIFDTKTGERFKILRFKVYALEKDLIARYKALSHSQYPRHKK